MMKYNINDQYIDIIDTKIKLTFHYIFYIITQLKFINYTLQ